MEPTLQLVIDCSDPQRMVTFWAEALAYVPEPPPAGHATWRSYWHFDLKVGGGRDVPVDVRAERVKAKVESLVKAGATVLRINDEPDMGIYAVAMQDPEGNEFDVV